MTVVRKRELEYGDITGLNILKIMSDRQNMHVWNEEIDGRTLIVGYMFPEEVPGVRVARPVEKKSKEKPSDGGLFNSPPSEETV